MLWYCEVASDDEVILFRDKNIITWKGSMKREAILLKEHRIYLVDMVKKSCT